MLVDMVPLGLIAWLKTILGMTKQMSNKNLDIEFFLNNFVRCEYKKAEEKPLLNKYQFFCFMDKCMACAYPNF
tara:strand:+ start:1636 stop:1854 length:219 start_codon:yes stop_codon:yes gene_type:complete